MSPLRDGHECGELRHSRLKWRAICLLDPCGTLLVRDLSRETYLFVELEGPAAAEAACRALNGASLNGSSVLVIPATSLRKLFVGNIDRSCDITVLHRGVAAVGPVS